MRKPVQKEGNDGKPIGVAARDKPQRGERQRAESSDDASVSFDPAKANAKEIFEDGRAKQDEDFIRLGKPE